VRLGTVVGCKSLGPGREHSVAEGNKLLSQGNRRSASCSKPVDTRCGAAPAKPINVLINASGALQGGTTIALLPFWRLWVRGSEFLADIGKSFDGSEFLADIGKSFDGSEFLADIGKSFDGSEFFTDIGKKFGAMRQAEISKVR
jgi:hypothetical protein